jgi:hypothetical protein
MFALSAGLGGVAAGALFGWIGSSVPAGVRAAVSVVLLSGLVAAGGVEILGRGVSLPQLDRETNQSWLHLGSIGWPVVNGLALGAGFLSRIGFLLWYLLPILCFAIGELTGGALVLGVYGFVRGAAVFGWFAYMNACQVGQGEVFEQLTDRKSQGQLISAWSAVSLGAVALFIVGG